MDCLPSEFLRASRPSGFSPRRWSVSQLRCHLAEAVRGTGRVAAVANYLILDLDGNRRLPLGKASLNSKHFRKAYAPGLFIVLDICDNKRRVCGRTWRCEVPQQVIYDLLLI